MIRKAKIEDLESLISLSIEENKHNNRIAPDRVSLTKDVLTIEELQEFINDEATNLSVYIKDNKPVGVILATHHEVSKNRWKNRRNFIYIEDFSVSKKYRGQGIGESLINTIIGWASTLEVEVIDLNVWEENIGAIELYKKIGFKNKQLLMTLNVKN